MQDRFAAKMNASIEVPCKGRLGGLTFLFGACRFATSALRTCSAIRSTNLVNLFKDGNSEPSIRLKGRVNVSTIGDFTLLLFVPAQVTDCSRRSLLQSQAYQPRKEQGQYSTRWEVKEMTTLKLSLNSRLQLPRMTSVLYSSTWTGPSSTLHPP